MASVYIPSVPDGTPLRNIADPSDIDVLSGRDAYVQRHPGNKNYRKLVNANKAQYITVRKPDKMKISRSIVAAVREKGGRFLEKGKGGDVMWHDIGDKKAVEKTSQALREGQPKLKQDIVQGRKATQQEVGHAFDVLVPTTEFPEALLLKMQSYSVSSSAAPKRSPKSTVEPIPVNLSPPQSAAILEPAPVANIVADATARELPLWSTGGASQPFQELHDMPQIMNVNGGLPLSIPEGSFHSQSHFADSQGQFAESQTDFLLAEPQQQSPFEPTPLPPQAPAMSTKYPPSYQQEHLDYVQPPQATSNDGNGYHDQQYHEYEQSLPLEDEAPVSRTMFDPHAQQYDLMQRQQQHHRMLQQQQQQYIQEQFEPPQLQQPYTAPLRQENFERKPPAPSRSFESMSNGSLIEAPMARPPSSRRNVDRRGIFANMKKQPHTTSSGRMDMNSSRSLDGMRDFHMVESQFSLMSVGGSSKTGAVAMPKDDLYLSSRRSLMSGISRQSGNSAENNNNNPPPRIFADMNKKVTNTNVSTRSIAMSEISGVEDTIRTEELQELIDWDLKHPSDRSEQRPSLRGKKSSNISTRSIAMSEISGIEESARTEDLQQLLEWELQNPSERMSQTSSTREVA